MDKLDEIFMMQKAFQDDLIKNRHLENIKPNYFDIPFYTCQNGQNQFFK